jgi:N-acetylglucosaminyldiphosphoundecaprenol N-acetyl-beta-D-mannosaminyltransferase
MEDLRIKNITVLPFKKNLTDLPDKKLIINTINAHSYNTSRRDKIFADALLKGDVLIPDGISIVYAIRLLINKKIEKITGWDLFLYEMNRINVKGKTCFFLGSSENTLKIIREKAKKEFPNMEIFTYSPPFNTEFSEEENLAMVAAINDAKPDVLFIGMTAPKQEKWVYKNFNQLNTGHICCIGAVFDFYAGTIKRAPEWMINMGIEWLYRLIKEPKRMWKRYLLGNIVFIYYVLVELVKSEKT